MKTNVVHGDKADAERDCQIAVCPASGSVARSETVMRSETKAKTSLAAKFRSGTTKVAAKLRSGTKITEKLLAGANAVTAALNARVCRGRRMLARERELARSVVGQARRDAARMLSERSNSASRLAANRDASRSPSARLDSVPAFLTRRNSLGESGQGTTEYAILVGVLVVIAILAITLFRPRLQELWTAISDGINSL